MPTSKGPAVRPSSPHPRCLPSVTRTGPPAPRTPGHLLCSAAGDSAGTCWGEAVRFCPWGCPGPGQGSAHVPPTPDTPSPAPRSWRRPGTRDVEQRGVAAAGSLIPGLLWCDGASRLSVCACACVHVCEHACARVCERVCECVQVCGGLLGQRPPRREPCLSPALLLRTQVLPRSLLSARTLGAPPVRTVSLLGSARWGWAQAPLGAGAAGFSCGSHASSRLLTRSGCAAAPAEPLQPCSAPGGGAGPSVGQS